MSEQTTKETPKPIGNEKTRFKPGNQLRRGKVNPMAAKGQKLKAALYRAVTKEDIREVAKKLIKDAKAGSVQAAHEMFDRLFGKSDQPLKLSGEIALRTPADRDIEAIAITERIRAILGPSGN